MVMRGLGLCRGTTYRTITEIRREERSMHQQTNMDQVGPSDTRSTWTRNPLSQIRPLLAQANCDGELMFSKSKVVRARKLRKRSRPHDSRRQLGWINQRSISY
jgi:hypothetical protein